MFVIVHSGQTGVERGAHRAAVNAGLPIDGFMPFDKRDELGPIPADVAQALKPYAERGPRPAVRANVNLASGVMLVVPDAKKPEKFTAMSAVLQSIRTARVHSLICDSTTNLEDVARWARHLAEITDPTRIVVTGPRETRWPEGLIVARRLVAALAHATDS